MADVKNPFFRKGRKETNCKPHWSGICGLSELHVRWCWDPSPSPFQRWMEGGCLSPPFALTFRKQQSNIRFMLWLARRWERNVPLQPTPICNCLSHIIYASRCNTINNYLEMLFIKGWLFKWIKNFWFGNYCSSESWWKDVWHVIVKELSPICFSLRGKIATSKKHSTPVNSKKQKVLYYSNMFDQLCDVSPSDPPASSWEIPFYLMLSTLNGQFILSLAAICLLLYILCLLL